MEQTFKLNVAPYKYLAIILNVHVGYEMVKSQIDSSAESPWLNLYPTSVNRIIVFKLLNFIKSWMFGYLEPFLNLATNGTMHSHMRWIRISADSWQPQLGEQIRPQEMQNSELKIK